MNLRILILLGVCCLIASCKSNFSGKEFNYLNNKGRGFKMVFINDSILEVHPQAKVDASEKAIYKYQFLKKEILETIIGKEHFFNFKTKQLYGQFYQNIAIQKLSGQKVHFNENDTLIFVKMQVDGKIKKRIYFNNGFKFIEL